MLDKLFFEHPRDIGESYGEHAGHALDIGGRLLLAGFACLVHALVPGLLIRRASNTVDYINELMAQREARVPTQSTASAGVPATMMENPSN